MTNHDEPQLNVWRSVFTDEVIRAIGALARQQNVCREQGGQVVFVTGMEAAREYIVEQLVAAAPPSDPWQPIEHGRTCVKAKHLGDGYLHGENDDRPYDVDGVLYCGRCHSALAVAAKEPEPQ